MLSELLHAYETKAVKPFYLDVNLFNRNLFIFEFKELIQKLMNSLHFIYETDSWGTFAEKLIAQNVFHDFIYLEAKLKMDDFNKPCRVI